MSDLHPQTGPTTPEGKARCSQNALTFGFTSQKLIVGDERQEDYNALLADLLAEFRPATAHDRGIVEDAALARWMLWRKQRAYNAVEATIYENFSEPAAWGEEIFHRLALADRYRTHAERAFQRASKGIESLRRVAISEEQRAARERHWQIKFEQSQRNLKFRESKVSPMQQKEDAKIAAKEKEKAYQGFANPTLTQYITVSSDASGTYTVKSPSNERLLAEMEKPSGEYHYVQVNREYLFEDGIPPQYHWTTDNEAHRQEKYHRMDHLIGLDAFRAVTKTEATKVHCVYGPTELPDCDPSAKYRPMRNAHPPFRRS